MARKQAKAKPLSARQATAKEMAEALGDLRRDLEVFAEGRGTHERFWTIYMTIADLQQKCWTLDPNRPVEAEVVPDDEARRLERKPLALTHQPVLLRGPQ